MIVQRSSPHEIEHGRINRMAPEAIRPGGHQSALGRIRSGVKAAPTERESRRDHQQDGERLDGGPYPAAREYFMAHHQPGYSQDHKGEGKDRLSAEAARGGRNHSRSIAQPCRLSVCACQPPEQADTRLELRPLSTPLRFRISAPRRCRSELLEGQELRWRRSPTRRAAVTRR